jgi:hypothetical protein
MTIILLFSMLLVSVALGKDKATTEDPISADSTAETTDQEQATLFPIPDYSGDFFSRSALTGDLQVIDGALKDADTAVVVGFRGRIVF